MNSIELTKMILACKGTQGYRDVQKWGPEAALARRLMAKKQERLSTLLSDIRDTFDPSGDIRVNEKKANRLINKIPDAVNMVWKDAKKGLKPIYLLTASRSMYYFKKQRANAIKLKADDILEDEEEFEWIIAALLLKYGEEFTSTFGSITLPLEVSKLVELAATNPRFREVDRDILKKRIEKVLEKGEDYFNSLTDVEIGKVWSSTGIELAYRYDVEEYQIVAQMDDPNKPCEPCQMLHGHRFSVVRARDSMLSLIESNDPEAAKTYHPFPRKSDLMGRSPEEISESGYVTPFHPRCRCDIVFLWSKPI